MLQCFVAVTSSCSGGGAGRRLAAKSTAYLASIESLEDSDEGKRLQRLKPSSQGNRLSSSSLACL